MYACMYAMRGCMHRQVGAGVQVLCGYVCVQVWYAMQCTLRRYGALCGTGRRDGVRMQWYAMQICTNGQVCAMQHARPVNGRAMHDFDQKWTD